MFQDVKCELNPVSHFVRQKIHLFPNQIEQYFQERNEQEAQTYFKTGLQNALFTIKDISCKFRKKVHWKNYKSTHIQEAVELLDILQEVLESDDAKTLDSRLAAIYKIIENGLNEILTYLNNSRTYTTGSQIPIPHQQYKAAVTKMRQDVFVLKEKMVERDVKRSLQDVILLEIGRFCDMGWWILAEQEYMELLMKDLLFVLEEVEGSDWPRVSLVDWNRKIAFKLIYLNFNSPLFIDHCWNYITADVDKEKLLSGQELRFRFHEKEIEKLTVMPGLSKMQGKSVAAALLKHVSKDLKYIFISKSLSPDKDLPKVDFTAKSEAQQWILAHAAFEYLNCSSSVFYRERKICNWVSKKINGKMLYKKSSLYLSRNLK